MKNKTGKVNGAWWEEGDCNFVGRKGLAENVAFD